MCGIYLTNKLFLKEEVEAKLNKIKYRGPDNLGYLKVDNISFGHLRLAILDLDERSNQPFSNFGLEIVFNGEIYNFIELKTELIKNNFEFQTNSDTEVILAAYRFWGEDFVKKLNGMFSFCIYDGVKQQIFCARDCLGVKPFYYTYENGFFEICSQIGPIKDGRSISSKAISMYLSCGYVPSPYSIFVGVFKLSPGSILKIDLLNQKIDVSKYWDIEKPVLTKLNYKEAKNKLHELLKDSIKIRLQSDVPFGSFLSGGIDSALVSAIASNLSDSKINTFTIGFDEKKYDESKLALEFSKIIGSNHSEFICQPNDILELLPTFFDVYDEPFSDNSALPTLLLNSKASNSLKMALSGDGGDESFLGYYHFNSVNNFSRLLKIPVPFRNTLVFILKLFNIKSLNSKFIKILELPDIKSFIRAIFIDGYDSLLLIPQPNLFSDYEKYMLLSDNPIQQSADYNIKLWLENNSNVKVDRGSMAFSMEIRSPFLDYRIIEFARTLPVRYRFRMNVKKRILRDILENYIDNSVFDVPKKGFILPFGKWIKEDLKEMFDNQLNDLNLMKIPNLNVAKFKEKYDSHLNSKEDNSLNIWRVFALSVWLERNEAEILNDL